MNLFSAEYEGTKQRIPFGTIWAIRRRANYSSVSYVQNIMDVFEIHILCFTIADVVLIDKCVHGFEASS